MRAHTSTPIAHMLTRNHVLAVIRDCAAAFVGGSCVPQFVTTDPSKIDTWGKLMFSARVALSSSQAPN